MSLPAHREPSRNAFDDRGVPLTVDALSEMGIPAISVAVMNSVARLKHKTVHQYRAMTENGGDGTPRLDSQVVIWLIAEFSRPVGQPIVDLSAIPDREQWSTVGALSRLIKESVQ